MRLLHLNDHLDWVGGIETYLLSTIGLLRESGWSQAGVFGKGDPSHMEQAWQIPEVSSPRPRDRMPAKNRVLQVIRDFQPDMAQVHNLFNVGAIEACLEAVPTVLHIHDFRYLCPASSFYHRRPAVICERKCSAFCLPLGPVKRCLTPRIPLNLWYYQRVAWVKKNAHRFQAIIAISGYVRDRLVEAGFPSAKIHVLPYFCPLDPVNEPPPPPDKPVILYMGRMAKYKGFEEFIRVLAKLPRDVHGLMIGNLNDSVSAEVTAQASELGCFDRLTVRGWASRDEIRDIMQSVSLVTFPSLCPETLGLVGMEALSSGVPVVGYRVGGVGEWLRDGETGFAVEVKDTQAFADRLATLIRNPTLRQRLGENGIALIHEKFRPESHLTQLRHVYEEAAGSSASAGPSPLTGAIT